MNITQVKVFPVQEEKLKAFVSIVFDHCFMVNDIKVIQGKDGLFLSMPSRRKRSGEFKDVAHPLNHETRREIELKVLEEYRIMVDDHTPRRPDRVEDDDHEPVVAPVARIDEHPARNGDPQPVPVVAHEAPSEPSKDDLPQVAAAEDSQVAPAPSDASDDANESKTLEEVQEAHLSDSFWSVG